MEKDFKYISASNIIFILLLTVGLPVPVFASVALEKPGSVFWVLMVWVLWLLMGVLSVCTSHLTGHFKADEKECDFQFFRNNLHFRYDEISSIQLFNIPQHDRFNNLIGYKIQLKITDKQENEYVIQQRISAEYSSYEYPQQFPEEVQNAEFTQIGNFLKAKISSSV